MPRGVYERKPKAAPKRAAKKAPTTTRRRRAPRGEVVEIPTISRSQLRSSVSDVRTPDTPQTLRSEIAPMAAEAATDTTLSADDVKFALFGEDGDGEIDWGGQFNDHDTFEAAEAAAREAVEDDGKAVYIVQIVGIVEKSGVTVRRTGPRL